MSLRRRLALALVGLTIASSAVLGFAYWLSEAWVERTSLFDLLEHELNRRVAEPLSASPTFTDRALRFYRPAQRPELPPALAALPPGDYASVVVEGLPYRALVREIAPGDRAYLLFEVSGIASLEHELVLGLLLGEVLIAVLAWLLAQRLAARTLAPLNQLVHDIGALDPGTRGQRLAGIGDEELQVIVAALNGYMQRLDAVIERERAFAAAAGHELRTPLAVIQNATELLEAGSAQQRPLARIQRAAFQARQDLDALLALARGRVAQTECLALAELLPELAEPHVLAQGEGAARLEWDIVEAVSLQANRGELGIVFTNLLRNALRAATQVADGCVRVRLDRSGVQIIDNGLGIPADLLPAVFEPWLAGRDGGTGVGLYIARTVAQRAGWTLQLSNLQPRGVRGELRFAAG